LQQAVPPTADYKTWEAPNTEKHTIQTTSNHTILAALSIADYVMLVAPSTAVHMMWVAPPTENHMIQAAPPTLNHMMLATPSTVHHLMISKENSKVWGWGIVMYMIVLPYRAQNGSETV